MKGNNDGAYLENSKKAHYSYKSHSLYVLLMILSILSLFLISNILTLPSETILMFASSGQDEDDDEEKTIQGRRWEIATKVKLSMKIPSCHTIIPNMV